MGYASVRACASERVPRLPNKWKRWLSWLLWLSWHSDTELGCSFASCCPLAAAMAARWQGRKPNPKPNPKPKMNLPRTLAAPLQRGLSTAAYAYVLGFPGVQASAALVAAVM